MDHISIIIVHYNTDKDTKDCLKSLQQIKHEQFDYQVLVVDNGSKKPFALPASLQDGHTEVVRSQANLGFTGGNNLGLFYAKEHFDSNYYLLLNSDTLVQPNFLTELWQYHQAHPEVGLVAPKIYFAKNREYHDQSYSLSQRGRVFWYAGGSIDWPNLAAFHRGVDEVDYGQFDQPTTPDFVTGCAMLIPRPVLDKVGLLDKRYFLYLEDVDYSLRVVQAGYQLAMAPKAVVWHKNAGSSGGAGSNTSLYYQTRNRLVFGLIYGDWKVKLTVGKLALQYLMIGSTLEKKAVFDFLIGRRGKQPII